MSRSNSSSSSPVFRAFAVVVAISVVGYLVYNAQAGAGRRQPAQQPEGGPQGPGPVAEPSLDALDRVLLPSSKDAVLPSSKGVVLPSSKFDVLEQPLLFGSKSGAVPPQEQPPTPLLPSSKVLVIPDEATGEQMKELAEEVDKQKPDGGATRIVELPSTLSSSKSIVIPTDATRMPVEVKKKDAKKDGKKGGER